MSDKLPSCMVPDGADPCEAYQELYIENLALKRALRKISSYVFTEETPINVVNDITRISDKALANK